MTKEEQIEEMVKDIAGIEQQEDLTLGEVYGIEATFELAEILFDAGYRKADEVRKETARAILQTMYNCQTCRHPTIATGNFLFGKDYIRSLATEYSVEVEE